MRGSLLIAIIVFFTKIGFGQVQKYSFQELSQKYPDENLVVLENTKTLDFQLKSGKLIIKQSAEISRLHLNSKTIAHNSESIPHTKGFMEIESLEAYTQTALEKGKILKVKNFEDKEYIRNDIFYDGVKYRNFLYPGIEKGAVTHLKYVYHMPDPNFLLPHFFFSSSPTLTSVLEVNVPSGVSIKYKMFGDSSKIRMKVTKNKDVTQYRWEMKDLNDKKRFGDAPGFRYYEPHVYVFVEKYKSGNQWIPVLSNEKDLYKLFYSFTTELNKKPAVPELKAVVDSIQKVSKNQTEVMKGVYYWVQDNIRYIAFEDGYGGQIPRQANDVFTKKYGDCKDLASLITFMLKQAEIPAYLVWIGTNELPYRFMELPTPGSCNHMIAAVRLKNDWVFLDGTSNHTSFGKPSQFIQGKEAMIGISPDSFVVAKVPVVPAAENKIIDTSYIALDQTKIKGNTKLILKGYNKSELQDHLYYTRENDRKEELENFLRLGNAKCQINNMDVKGWDSKDKPLVFKFDFVLDDMVKQIDDEMYVSMITEQNYNGLKIDTVDRNVDKQEEYTYNEESIKYLKLPKGYTVKKMPKNQEISNPNLTFSCQYKLVNDQIEFRKKFIIHKIYVPQKDFKNWNDAIDKLLAAKKEHLVLKQIKK